MRMHCPYCDKPAALVTGLEIYPHRDDLADLKFWSCAPCNAYVGCHKAGSWHHEDGKKVIHDGTEPLGRMANAELRQAKQAAHAAFDPLWKSRRMDRREAYAWLASKLGISVANCHIGMMDVAACKAVALVCHEYRHVANEYRRSCA